MTSIITLVGFICTLIVVGSVAEIALVSSTDPQEINSNCTSLEAKTYSGEFHACFNEKYGHGSKNVENIIERVLEHSTSCMTNLDIKCKLDLKGFTILMDSVIYQLKDYCFQYLEHVTKDRDKIKDLECVEKNLTVTTYKLCFEDVFVNQSSVESFQQNVEKAIACTNKSQRSCSKEAKTRLNRMVRLILGVKQPSKEEFEEDLKPKPQKRWYEYIIQPFISLWRAVKSFFGF